jgi:hypothetical protein
MSDNLPAAAHDFVDRLVMKALGTADLPVPRLPSLYESPAPIAGFPRGDADTEEAFAEIDVASPIRRARAPVSTARVGPTSPAPPHASPVTSTPTLEPVGGPRFTPAQAASGRSRRAVVARDPADVRPPAHHAAGGTAAEPVADDAGRGTGRPMRPAGNDAIDPDADPRRSRPLRPEALVAVPRSHASTPTPRRRHRTDDAPGAEAEPRHGILVPRASGLALPGVAARPAGVDRPRRADGPGDGPETDVTVNVTIGRIEVRATPAGASAAPRTPSRGPQPLALDEYLGQRGAR